MWLLRALLVVGLLLLGSWLTSLLVESGPGSWYAGLDKVPWTPPSWLFSPVWISLYILMGVGFTLQWRHGFDSALQRRARNAFCIQLLFNLSYTPVQFGLQWLSIQAIVILAVLFSAAFWVHQLWKLNRIAAILQFPYLVWVAYASTVAVGLWWLNR